MALLAALLAGGLFSLVFYALRRLGAAGQALATARAGMAALRDRALDDDAKEAAARRTAIALFKTGLGLALRLAVALGVSLGVLFLGGVVGMFEVSKVLALFTRWWMWLVLLALFFLPLAFKRRR